MAKFLSALLFLAISDVSSAHGGGLDSQGCHNETKTDSYHCHRSTGHEITPQKKPSGKRYNRKDYGYRSYRPSTSVGFYTGEVCSSINIDHIVSLKDAHESGAHKWGLKDKSLFANDRDNHVPSCRDINSSKGSATPKEFLRRSRDGKGLDYKIIRFCDYVKRYHSVKTKYGLSFTSNSKRVFLNCGIRI